MSPRITCVQHVHQYVLRLFFADGKSGEIDLATRIRGRGGVFTPLEDQDYFTKVTIDPEAHTLVWPNGVDLDPDSLYSQVTGAPLPVPQTI